MNKTKLLLVIIIASLITAFFWLDGEQYINIGRFQNWVNDNIITAAIAYFFMYVVITGLSLPGATAITLLGGAVFGLWLGLLLVSFASTIGATLAFLLSRSLFSDWVNKKFGGYLHKVNEGINREGPFYLFSLRLIPAIPFFVINLVFGLSKMKTWTFYWVSQVGMLAGTFLFVNAGAQLGAAEELSVSGIFTPTIVGSFILLALFPFIVKSVVAFIQSQKVYKPFKKPKHFDVNLTVIGAGSGGLVSSYIAAAVKAKVILIEKHKMGGDCLNTGCVPSKALIRAAKTQHTINNAHHVGIENTSSSVNFPQVMKRIHKVIADIEPHDSIERYTNLGVECIQGEAKILSPFEVQVGEKIITTKNIIIATGARPFIPPIKGLDTLNFLSSDNLWQLSSQPKKLLVMGGGPIGCELAQSFQRLGTQVTLVDMADRLMPREDSDVSDYILNTFKEEGVDVRLNKQIIAFKKTDSGGIATLKENTSEIDIEFDQVLVAVGRKANTDNLNLDTLGISLNPNGTVLVDDFLRTQYPNIYACGDVAGPYQFTHTASHQAWYASVNALFGRFKKFRVDYRVIPWATFTDPEVARVGLSEAEAKEKNIQYDLTRYGIDDLDRAIADNNAKGFVKVLTAKGKDKILGCTIVGANSGELITEFVSAMKHNIGLNKILGTIHIYPTMSEANKYVAGEWKRANVSQNIMAFLDKFHQWMRR